MRASHKYSNYRKARAPVKRKIAGRGFFPEAAFLPGRGRQPAPLIRVENRGREV
jgi:hypothetical protein